MAQVILRLTLDTNAVGPFNIYTGSTATSPILSNKTRDQLVAGIPYDFPAEPNGTSYTLIFENLQPGCEDQTITKRFTLTGNSDIIDLTATYEPGSVVATYFARARYAVDKRVEFDFVNVLGVTSGDPVVLNASIFIPEGGTTGSTVVSDSGADFNLLDYSSTFSGVTFTTTGASEYVFSANFNYVFPTPTPTPTFAPSATPTITPTMTPTSTFAGITPTPTPSSTFTGITSTPTITPSSTFTGITVTPTQTITGVTTTPTATPSSTPAVTPDITATPFATATPTLTTTPTITPSSTFTGITVTPTQTITGVTQTPTPTLTQTPTQTITGVTTTPTATPSSTPAVTPSNTATNTPTPTPSNTAGVSQTPTPTHSATPSVTPSVSVSPTATSTPTSTPQATVTVTPSNTPTNTPQATATPTVTVSSTPTGTPVATPTNTPTVTASNTPTPTQTPVSTSTPTATVTPTVTQSPSSTPQSTVTPTPSNTADVSQTPTPTHSPTPSVTPSISVSPTLTPTITATVSPTATPTSTPQATVTPTASNTPTSTPASTSTPTVTPSATPSETPAVTPTSTSTPTQTAEVTPTATATSTPTQTPTLTQTVTPSTTPAPTPDFTATPFETPTQTPTLTQTVTNSPTPSTTVELSPTPTLTSTPSGTPQVTVTPTVTSTPDVTPTSTVTQTPGPTKTPSSTPEPTPTNTPSSTPAETTEFYLNEAAGAGSPDSNLDCQPVDALVYTNDFGPVGNAQIGDFVFVDPGLTTPFAGANLWYDAENTAGFVGTVKFQIEDTGRIRDIAECPTPVTPTPTATPAVTPTSTVTQTPGPTKTPSSTPEPTQTSTPTPSPAATIEFYLNATQGAGFPDSSQECQPVDALVYTNDFGPVGNAQIGDFVFLDPGLTTPFAGANLWYDAENTAGFIGTVKFQIENTGRIRDIADCPTPVTPTPTATPAVTPTSTVTQTPGPTKTPSSTPEPTPTNTPSPTPAETIEFFFNAGPSGGAPDSNLECQPVNDAVYSNDFNTVTAAQIGDFVFVDPGLTTPFQGADLWYDAEDNAGFIGVVKFQIDNSGLIRDIADCPTPVTPTPTQTPTQTAEVTPTPTTPGGTSTPTPSPTPSVTPSISATPTHTPTPSVTPSTSLTPTPSVTPSVSPSQASLPPAYLIIEPSSIGAEIGNYMFNTRGNFNFYGYSNASVITQTQDIIDYLSFYNLNAGVGNVPAIISSPIPQSSGGVDSFGNSIIRWNFETMEVSPGTAPGDGYYTLLIPDDSIGGTSSGNRQTIVDFSFGQGPNTFSQEVMDPGLFALGPVVNPGGHFLPGSYRVYTTNVTGSGFFFDNSSETIYFKGNTVA